MSRDALPSPIALRRMSSDDLRTPLLPRDDLGHVRPVVAPSMDSSFENLWAAASSSTTPRTSGDMLHPPPPSVAGTGAGASASESGTASPSTRRLSAISNRFRSSIENLSAAVTKLPEKLPKSRSLNYRQQMTLSPFAKFKRFRRIPFKFIFNLLVVVLVTTRVSLLSSQFNNYTNGQHDTFDALFRPQPDFWRSPLYFIEDVVGHFNSTVDAYYRYVKDSVQPISNWKISKDREFHIDISVEQYVHRDPFGYSVEDLTRYFTNYRMNSTHRETPFDNLSKEELRHLFNRLIRIEVSFRTLTVQTDGPYLGEMRYEWTCVSQYDFKTGGGQVQHLMTIYKRELKRQGTLFLSLDLATMVCAIASSLLTIKALYRAYKIYRFAKNRLSHRVRRNCTEACNSISWEKLSTSDKLSFFNSWYLVTLMSDAFLVAACAATIHNDDGHFTDSTDRIDGVDVARSLGCFLAWINLLKFLQWRPDFYVLFLAIRCAMGRVLRFIFAILPIYMAYVTTGVVLFSNVSDKFGSLDNAAVTLFALANGDSIFEVFSELNMEEDTAYRVLGRIYLYTFCAFFISSVLNVFVFIIEDGYRLASTFDKSANTDANNAVLAQRRLRQILNAAYCSSNEPHEDDEDGGEARININGDDDGGDGGDGGSGGAGVAGSDDGYSYAGGRAMSETTSLMSNMSALPGCAGRPDRSVSVGYGTMTPPSIQSPRRQSTEAVLSAAAARVGGIAAAENAAAAAGGVGGSGGAGPAQTLAASRGALTSSMRKTPGTRWRQLRNTNKAVRIMSEVRRNSLLKESEAEAAEDRELRPKPTSASSDRVETSSPALMAAPVAIAVHEAPSAPAGAAPRGRPQPSTSPSFRSVGGAWRHRDESSTDSDSDHVPLKPPAGERAGATSPVPMPARPRAANAPPCKCGTCPSCLAAAPLTAHTVAAALKDEAVAALVREMQGKFSEEIARLHAEFALQLKAVQSACIQHMEASARTAAMAAATAAASGATSVVAAERRRKSAEEIAAGDVPPVATAESQTPEA